MNSSISSSSSLAPSTFAPALSTAPSCSFWTAQLDFTRGVSGRHFCLLGDNRYTAPETFGPCNDDSSSEACTTCFSLNGQERACNYQKGIAADLDTTRALAAGYSGDFSSCPVGFEQYTNVTSMALECPLDSVLVLELFATDSYYYDFDIITPSDVVRRMESHQCLTGMGGMECGDDNLILWAYHEEGDCSLRFQSGRGYLVECQKNQLISNSNNNNFLGGGNQQSQTNCTVNNGLLCSELERGKTQITVVDDAGDNWEGTPPSTTEREDEDDELCNLDDWSSLNNPVALLVGAGVMLLTLVPGVSYFRVGYIGPTFLMGLLSEAIKNGGVIATAISVDWHCFLTNNGGSVIPLNRAEEYAIFLPYALIAFSFTDTILSVIALFANWGQDLEGNFDQFKWIDENNNLSRRIMTFLTIVIFGGLGGFMQLGLILEGTVDSTAYSTDDEESDVNSDESFSVWASWVFIVSTSLGGISGICLVLYGVYIGNMRMAWKVFKFLVGNIAGIVSSIEIANILLVGWGIETLNDIMHLVLYIPAIGRK